MNALDLSRATQGRELQHDELDAVSGGTQLIDHIFTLMGAILTSWYEFGKREIQARSPA